MRGTSPKNKIGQAQVQMDSLPCLGRTAEGPERNRSSARSSPGVDSPLPEIPCETHGRDCLRARSLLYTTRLGALPLLDVPLPPLG